MMTLVSRNIRYLRRLHGMTQEEFANKIGIKRPSLGAYEESRATPNLANLQIIAKTFNISVDDLISLDIRLIKEKASIHTENDISDINAGEDIKEDLEEMQKEAQEIISRNLAKDLEEKLKINQQQNNFLNDFRDNQKEDYKNNFQDNYSEKKQVIHGVILLIM